MNNKPYIIAVAIVVIFVAAFFILQLQQQEQPERSAPSRAEVIEEAENYQPPEGTFCTQVLTPAVHIETGVEYTFPTGCLPDGWRPANS